MIELLELIQTSPRARTAINYFGEQFRDIFSKLGRPLDDASDERLRVLFAEYILDAITWTDDTNEFRVAKDRDGIKPSQVRYAVIKELRDIARVFDNPNAYLRRRKTLSSYAVRALRKQEPLGPLLLSHLQSMDGDAEAARHHNVLGLGGTRNSAGQGGDNIFGFINPAPVTHNKDTMVRLVKRMNAQTVEVADSHLLRADEAEWSISNSEDDALTATRRARRGRHLCLHDLRWRLTEVEKKHLAECARQAARLLEITYHMTDAIKGNQAKETQTTWLKPYPLGGFFRQLFELLAPTKGQCYEDILAPQAPSDGDALTVNAMDLAKDGVACANEIVTSVPVLRTVDLDAGAGLLKVSNNMRKLIKKSLREQQRELSEEDYLTRMEAGRSLIAKSLWTLRRDMVIMRGFNVFFGWYKSQLLKHLPPEENTLFAEYNSDIFAPVTDWRRELEARYQECIVYKHDGKRRAGGMPVVIPETPEAVSLHCPRIVKYPDGHGFGARFDENVVRSILLAIGERRPNAAAVWTRSVAAVPLTLLPT